MEVTAFSCTVVSSDVNRLTRAGIAPASAIRILLSVLLLDSDRISVTAVRHSSMHRPESFRTRDSMFAISPLMSRKEPSLFFIFPLIKAVGCSVLLFEHHWLIRLLRT